MRDGEGLMSRQAPARQAPPSGQPPAPEPPRKGLEVGLLPFVASLVGLLLVVGIIGAVVWFTRDGGDEPVATATNATQPNGALSGTPQLTIESDGDVFTYTASYDKYVEGDVYLIQKGPDARALEGAEPVRLKDGETEHDSNVADGLQECARAQVVRGGQSTAWSSMTCETDKGA